MVNISAYKLHRWAGLCASLWLAVLCITGIMLEHKNNWHWLWNIPWPGALMSADSAAEARAAQFHQFKISGTDYLTCGPHTCLTSHDAGQHWQGSEFSGPQPLIRQVLRDNGADYIATDNGIWRSTDQGRNFSPWLLPTENISYLAKDGSDLFAVINASKITQIDLRDTSVHAIELPLIPLDLLPAEINLGRLTHDIHYARGIFGGDTDIWLQDISAVIILLLIFSGLYMYFWRRKPAANKAQRFRFLLHMHRLLLGPIAIVGLLYLSITGILLDHSNDLRTAMREIKFPSQMLTPVYHSQTWQNKITSLAALDKRLFIGTRFGIYEYSATGLVKGFNSYAWSMASLDGIIYAGGMGGPSAEYRNGNWQVLAKAPHMPSDITVSNQGLLWKSPHKTALSDGTPVELNQPETTTVPLYFVVNALHSGLLFHAQWKWMNDLIALLGLLAMLTGLWRLWRWLKFRLHKRRR